MFKLWIELQNTEVTAQVLSVQLKIIFHKYMLTLSQLRQRQFPNAHYNNYIFKGKYYSEFHQH